MEEEDRTNKKLLESEGRNYELTEIDKLRKDLSW